ncbi:hypothetical protein BU23DRAFT_448949, partial [Bimuria novae-zelandiae CBS 107.79]
ESPVGYAIFKVLLEADSIGLSLAEVCSSMPDLSKFGKMISLVGFFPFQGTQHALQGMDRPHESIYINDLSDDILSDFRRAAVEATVPHSKKTILGVSDKSLAASVKVAFPKMNCETGETSQVVAEYLRGSRLHGPKLVKSLRDAEADLDQARLGLGNAYSRLRVKFSNQGVTHIMQAIATLH